LFICNALKTIGDRHVTLSKQFTIAVKFTKQRLRHDEQAEIPNTVMIAIGMKVMLVYNIETDLNITNGARGEIVKIILNENEKNISLLETIINLEYPPPYILVKMNSFK
ncbi:hypothetical protein EV363DRAFT_1100690, partial [Boletus edulis]